MTGFAGDGDDLDGAVGEFGDLELEQSADKIRMAARDDDLGALGVAAYFDDQSLDPIAPLEPLVGNALRTGHDRLGVTQVEDGETVVYLLDDAGYEIALPTLVEVEDLFALDVAQPLLDHLLGRLGGDPAEIVR